MLGDSFAEGLQVRLEDTFGAVLERELAQCPGVPRAGRRGLQLRRQQLRHRQELLTLRERVWDVEPDLVLLAFFSGNDVWDNSKDLKQDPELPYFSLKGDALVLDDSFQDSPGSAPSGRGPGGDQGPDRVLPDPPGGPAGLGRGPVRGPGAGAAGVSGPGDEFAGNEAQRRSTASRPTRPGKRPGR